MKRNQPEADLQKLCVAWLKIQENQNRLAFFHIPNGGKRNVREAVKFKAMGVRAGVPDLAIMWIDKIGFIELKHGKGKLTDNQKNWRDIIRICGHEWAECRSLDEVMDTVNGWIK